MRNHIHLSSRHRLFSYALLGCACAALPARQGRAQTSANASATVGGIYVIESSGVYPTSNTTGSSRYIDAGAGNGFPSFVVLDYNTSSFGLTAPATSFSNVVFSVNESDFASTKAGSFTLYLSENTASVATANGGSPLMYQAANAPSGLGTQLGTSGSTLFPLATFTSSGSTTSTSIDTYSLTLSGAAQSYLAQEFSNTSTNNDVRLVLASNDTTGYLTLDGNTSAVATATPAGQIMPTLSFTAALNQTTLNWTPGGSSNTNGGAGNWLPQGTAGDTSWGGGGWNNANVAIFAGTGGAVAIGTGGVSAQGIQFNTTGYTLGTAGGPAITLTSGGVVQVTHSTDTDTINAPIAGTVGLNKVGAGTLVLGGTNTYTGTTTISAGTLQVSSDAALGATGDGVALATGTLASGVTNGTLALTRGLSGSGGLNVASGATLSTSGVVNTGALTLTGGGTVLLTNTGSNTSDGANHAFTSVTFQTGGAALVTQNAGVSGQGVTAGEGIADVGGLTATNASGTSVTFAANTQPSTATLAVSVTNAGATLNLPGAIAGAAVLAKTGAGTLVLGGDNSALAGSGTTPASMRQGTAGTNPVSGGILSIPASNPNPGYALGTGQYQANGGTISNDTGGAITLQVASISSGASTNAATPGGTVFAGSGAITVPGGVSLYKASTATTSYQHGMTFNTPTTFTGLFTVSTGTGNSTGLTLAGSSTLTLGGTAGANTFTEPVTIATSGSGSGVILAKDGAFGANTMITINATATLTINTGVTTGTVDAVNNAALLSYQAVANAFGKLALNIGTASETVGGLFLSTAEGKFGAGYLPAGTYGSSQSTAQNKDDTLFSGTGVLTNLGTAVAVPEPSAWTLAAVGLALLGWVMRVRRRAE